MDTIDMDGKISDHFSWKEVTTTNTAFKNRPDDSLVPAILYTASRMEIVRHLLEDKPVSVNSWFRSKEVNEAIGGTSNSQHTKGEAVDFICPTFGTPKDIAKELSLYANIIGFDQLILEPSWIHISFTRNNPRHQVLSYVSSGHYVSGLI